jgi:predicted ATPase
VDDAQWIDASSADALVFAVRRLLAEPVAILIAGRTETSPFDSAGLPVLEVRGLDADAARMLLVHHAGRTVPAETCEWLYRSTAGNPLALIELASEAPRLGVELVDRPLAVETRVEHAYARQIERLSDDARRALVIAAAAGSVDIEPIFRALRSVGLRPAALEEAECAGVLRIDDGSLEFRHPLMRSAVYHAASPVDRRAAHRALAEALAGGGDADQRAWHLGSAALGVSAPAADALAEMAKRALDRSAYAAAAAAFGRAAQLTSEDDARAARLLAAAVPR